jgi:hypothetical protein
MRYLNLDVLSTISAEQFQNTPPYPWMDVANSLTPEGYEALRLSLPNVELFDRQVGIKRGYGQAPHDRYLLHYQPSLALSQPWREFIAELQGEIYQEFLRRVLGPHTFIPTFEWYFAWQGCAVSPHCDAKRKLATHIFYFNTDNDWDPAWGGEILILDSERRFKTHSAPSFDELKVAASLHPRGNGSLFFQRTPHSWHGVRPLQCPRGQLRKLFLVTVNVPNLQVWWRKMRGKDPDGFLLRGEAAQQTAAQM